MSDKNWDFMLEQLGKERLSPTMNRWTNPELRKLETEDEFPDKIGVTYIPPSQFDTIKKQVGKKKISKKPKKERIADKSVSIAERLGYGMSK